MNRKGFMMAEVVVVSAVVLITLVSFYVSYNKIISTYNQRIDYYDVTALYDLDYVRDSITDYSSYSSMSSVLDEEFKKVYYLKKDDLSKLSVSNQTFKDYLAYIDDSVTFETDYILVMESCNDNIDDCKYAYLEVYSDNIDNNDSVVEEAIPIPLECSLIVESNKIQVSSIIDNDGNEFAYYGWNSSFSGDKSTSKDIAMGVHSYYVKDNAGNTGMCSITVASPTWGCPAGYSDTGNGSYTSMNRCYVYPNTWSYMIAKCTASQTKQCPDGYTATGNSPDSIYACQKIDASCLNNVCNSVMESLGSAGTLVNGTYCVYDGILSS